MRIGKFRIKKESVWKAIMIISSILLILSSLAVPLLYSL